MNKKTKIVTLAIGAALLLLAVLAWYVSHHAILVLQPRGPIGHKERQLIIIGVLLAVLVVVPVYVMAIAIAWKYREGNQRPKKYSPDWDHSRLFETIWWGIPIAIITVLSLVTWVSAHSLDPYKPIGQGQPPLEIQVVALDWKWLFIYPQQHIASVNLAQIPVGRPVDFHITSDSIMNSFWVPQLGGQIYAMPGMETQLHLQADQPGDYFGSPANIAGRGFSRMNFTVRAGSAAEFDAWIQTAENRANNLDTAAYNQLAKPSDDYPVTYYSTVRNNLFDDIVMKYMVPNSTAEQLQ